MIKTRDFKEYIARQVKRKRRQKEAVVFHTSALPIHHHLMFIIFIVSLRVPFPVIALDCAVGGSVINGLWAQSVALACKSDQTNEVST